MAACVATTVQWHQSDMCRLRKKGKAQVDLEGFTKPLRTVRPISIAPSTPVRCDAKFFPVKTEQCEETEKEIQNVESFKSFESIKTETELPKRQKKRKRELKNKNLRHEANAEKT